MCSSDLATGVKENMDKAGRSTEVTYEDVIKAIKAGEEKLKKIHNEKIVTTNESVQLTESEDSDVDDDVSFDEPRSSVEYDEKNGPLYDLVDKIETVADYSKKAASDEAVKEDIKKFENANSQLKQEFLTDEFIQILNTLANTDTENADDSDILKVLRDKFSGSDFISDLDSARVDILLSHVLPAYEAYTEAISNYQMKKDEREEMDSANAKHAIDSDSTINVGEQSVKICEEVYEVLNKYIARQWNLLALHSEHKTMPLCAKYITIDLDKLISDSTSPKAQAKTESVLGRSLSDWLNEVIEYDTSADEQREEVASGFEVKYSDIDLNVHTNFLKYLEAVCNVFSLDFYSKHILKRVEINFLRELNFGDKGNVYYEEVAENDFLFKLVTSEGVTASRSRMVFENKR